MRAVGPADAERRDRWETTIEVQPSLRHLVYYFQGRLHFRGSDSRRAYGTVVLRANRLLQDFRRTARPSVDAHVKCQQVDPGRKVVAAEDVPIIRPIDFGCGVAREIAYVFDRCGGFAAVLSPSGERADGYAKIGRASRIVAAVGEATLLPQDDVDATRKIGPPHCRRAHLRPGGGPYPRRRLTHRVQTLRLRLLEGFRLRPERLVQFPRLRDLRVGGRNVLQT